MVWQSLLLALLVCSLSYTAYEDFTHRGIVWWLFPVLLLLFIGWAWPFVSWEEWKWQIGLNLAFLILQLGLVFLYFSWKQRAWANITQHLLGWGDIFFMTCTTVLFSLPNFLLFHVGSLFVAIVLALVFPRIRTKGVPLAGIQASVLTLVLSTLNVVGFNPFESEWVLFLIS